VVDYRAIQEDTSWIADIAQRRLSKDDNYRKSDRAHRKALQEAAQLQVHADIQEMWRTLGEVGGKSIEEIEDSKSGIRRKVLMRQRHIWYTRYQKAMGAHSTTRPDQAWYKRWLLSGDGNDP